MVNVIIPAYNAHDTIDRAVASLAIQTYADQLDVIIVDDCSKKDYSETVEKFSNSLKIRTIRHEKNLGVGFARQTGLEACTHEYISFMDSDDVFLDALVFEKLIKFMDENPNTVLFSGSFIEELEDGTYFLREQSMYWTFSKIYRKSFLDKNNITFPPQNQNEDNIFNMNIKMCLKEGEEIKQSKEPMYLWKFNKSSITRKNDHEYWFHMDVIGVLRGFYHIMENPNINKNTFINDAINFFFIGYFRYFDSKKHRPKERWNREILKEVRDFYKKVIKPFNVQFTDALINARMNLVVKDHQKDELNIEKFRNFMKEFDL